MVGDVENKETAAENVIRWIMLEVEEMIGEGRDRRERDKMDHVRS